MTKKQKKNLTRIIIAAVLMILLIFIPIENKWLKLALYMIPYLIVGYDILIKAFKGIKNLQPFDECFLMAIATVGAIAVGIWGDGDFVEAVAVMLFYQIGEWFQSYAVGKSRKNISALMDIRPDYANIENDDGELEQVDPDEVEVGSVIIVQAGEKIPIDGVVVEGESSLNTSALTGESMPRNVISGDEVISGCINLNGLLKIKTTKEFGESTVSKILDLVENASSKKSKSENFISKFARIYTPAVVFSALALAVIPSVFTGDWSTWIYRALTFLVISCPCALVISIPLSFFAGIGGASKEGILVKGSNYLEILSKTKTVVFDKTGTLTKGVFEVTAIHPEIVDENTLLHLAAHVERYSTHPVAVSLRLAYPDEADNCSVEEVEEIAGEGVKAKVNGQVIYVGNSKLMDTVGAEWKECEKKGTIVHVCVDGEYAGHIVVSDRIKEDAVQAIKSLKENGVSKTVMLTGDKKEIAESVASEVGVDEYYSELLPADKVEKMEGLLAGKPDGKVLAFVGDGINDAPVLARADVGIAMGALGSDAAIEAADVVLMDDKPSKLAVGMSVARKALTIAKENTFFSIFIKVLVLLLAVVGLATMWMAVLADVGVMVLAVLNSTRALKA